MPSTRKCSICREAGHDKRTCAKKAAEAKAAEVKSRQETSAWIANLYQTLADAKVAAAEEATAMAKAAGIKPKEPEPPKKLTPEEREKIEAELDLYFSFGEGWKETAFSKFCDEYYETLRELYNADSDMMADEYFKFLELGREGFHKKHTSRRKNFMRCYIANN